MEIVTYVKTMQAVALTSHYLSKEVDIVHLEIWL